MKFVALDFETADYKRDSACSVGAVRVEGGRVVKKVYRLIRPPRHTFTLSWVHGLTWADVKDEPSFREVWRDISSVFTGVDFIAAHKADFDRAVLVACCGRARLRPPDIEFVCTVNIARELLRFRRAGLEYVSKSLGVPLDHHHALSDAYACARIVLAGARSGRARSRRRSKWIWPRAHLDRIV